MTKKFELPARDLLDEDEGSLTQAVHEHLGVTTPVKRNNRLEKPGVCILSELSTHMKVEGDGVIEAQAERTYQGMAYLAGTSPIAGLTCLSCAYLVERKGVENVIYGRCEMYTRLDRRGRKGDRFPGDALACKHWRPEREDAHDGDRKQTSG